MYISFAWSYIKFLYSFLHYGETIFHSLKSFSNLRKLKKKTKPKTPNQTDSCQLLVSTFWKRLFNFFPKTRPLTAIIFIHFKITCQNYSSSDCWSFRLGAHTIFLHYHSVKPCRTKILCTHMKSRPKRQFL